MGCVVVGGWVAGIAIPTRARWSMWSFAHVGVRVDGVGEGRGGGVHGCEVSATERSCRPPGELSVGVAYVCRRVGGALHPVQ